MEEIDAHKKLWVEQAVAKMSNKDLAKDILLFLQHSDVLKDNNEAETAGYKLYLWAEKELEKNG